VGEVCGQHRFGQNPRIDGQDARRAKNFEN
jgi:hypothetical protein